MPSLKLPIFGQRPPDEEDRGPLWRGLEDLAEVREPDGDASEGGAERTARLTRRSFLQLLGGSAALALEACQPPRDRIVPFVRQPPEIRPGIPLYYATAVSIDAYATGLIVTTHEGRPTKVEGNPRHPASLGAVGTLEQATLLDLYDPRRASGIFRRGQAMAWRTFLAEISRLAQRHAADGGARLAFLFAPDASPTLAGLRRRIQERFPRARLRSFAGLNDDAAAEGSRIAFGRPLLSRPRLDRAQVILSLDADLLQGHGEHLRYQHDWASRRDPGPEMSRLYVAEARLSVTGATADQRFRMRSGEVLGFARAIAAELAARGLPSLAGLGAAPSGGAKTAPRARAVAADLLRHRGRSLVVAGSGQPPELHALAHAMNSALGNAGATVTYGPMLVPDALAGPAVLLDLAREIEAGQVDMLVVTAWNPVYAAPAELALGPLLERVPDAIYLALRPDETWRRCSWRVAASHPFECWGDGRARDGTASIAQPLIAPLFESACLVDLLAAFLDEGDLGAARVVQRHWRARTQAASFETEWERWLAEGVVPGTVAPEETPALRWRHVADALAMAPAPAPGIELGFVADYKVHDGRFAGNAWLQELPEPITKITWDNAAYVSPATARRLGLGNGEIAQVALGERTLEAPVWILPGHADEALTLPLGYGRTVESPVGRGVGFDAWRLRTAGAPGFQGGAAVKGSGRMHHFASTQSHFAMEGRPLALDFTMKEWVDHGPDELAELRGPLATLLRPVDYSQETYKWGMAVDLGRCTGCSACVIACQEENNIPVVGKEQVARARQMQWLRIDRYFKGPPEDPEVIAQPLACVHCEAAPCEYVCPVNATVHSDEGLNEMVYNRCVGTRYCSNNCPYKVRRFNFLDYHADVSQTERMLMNPEVTVRARGVMEKCTYCVQRIEAARIQSRVEGRTIREGELQTACQQACPTQAIVFGNLNDSGSRVARLHRDPRRYDLLHELGTRPRTAYLARIRNPNPDPET